MGRASMAYVIPAILSFQAVELERQCLWNQPIPEMSFQCRQRLHQAAESFLAISRYVRR